MQINKPDVNFSSFVKPEAMKKPAPAPEAPVLSATPEDDLKKKAEEEGLKKKEADFLELKSQCEKELECELKEKDLADLLYKGVLVKEITIFPKLMKAEFRVLTAEEFGLVDQEVAKIEALDKHTRDGLADERAKVLLSYGWLSAGGRPLGNTPEERLATINKMPASSVVEASKKWNVFELLVRLSLGQGSFVKK